MAGFTLLAGVEITRGQVGLLDHGHVDGRRTFGDPVEAARRWVQQGATWLHVADLDAAAGVGDNHAIVARVVHAIGGSAHVQVAGGLRDDHTLAAAAKLGVRRLVIDAAALGDLDWVRHVIEEHRSRVAVDITAHQGAVHAPGSPADGLDLAGVLEALREARCETFVVTDVDARGARKSRDRAVLEEIARQGHGEVIACGGISRLEDLHALADMAGQGVHGAVVDAALYEDAFLFSEGLAAVEPRYDPYEWGPARP